MPRLRLGTSYWVGRPASRLHAFLRCGAKSPQTSPSWAAEITGATIAWRFARAGLRVALLDAAHVGRGSMAASTALLMQDPDADYAELADRYGDTRTRRIWQLSRSATRDVVRTIRQLNIRCHLAERDSVYYAPARRSSNANIATGVPPVSADDGSTAGGCRWQPAFTPPPRFERAATRRSIRTKRAPASCMRRPALHRARTAVTRAICLRSGMAATA
jgi:hypothetical protein